MSDGEPADEGTEDFRMQRDGAYINRTELALLSRGIDSAKAARLRAEGWTLAKLQQETAEALGVLGLSEHEIAGVQAGARPEIPTANLMQVLVAERFTCCVCREPELPVIVHHIREWHESRDHSPSNLALLCHTHHDRAHSHSTLSRNLTPDLVAKFKSEWESEVRKLDTGAVLTASRLQHDAWVYFNHLRLFELARAEGVELEKLPGFASARGCGLITKEGLVSEVDRTWSYMYDSGDGSVLYSYVRDVLHALLSRIKSLNISDMMDRSVLSAVVQRGDFVVLQGAFNFSSASKDDGRGQTVVGQRRVNHVQLEFTFDRWEATSNSAKGRWLRGRQEVAVLVRLVNVRQEGELLHLDGTVIAISQALNGLKTREYATFPFRQGVIRFDDESQDEEDDDVYDLK